MSMDEDRLLADARREVSQKSRDTIEEETAYKWAARAVAAYEFAQGARRTKPDSEHRWLRDCDDYYHEAIEHAAFADHSGEVLHRVRQWMYQYIPSGY